MIRALAAALVAALVSISAGCASGGADPPLAPTDNPDRGIADTKLRFDLAARSGTASITFEPSASPGASLDVRGLTVGAVTRAGTQLDYAIHDGQLTLALASSSQPQTVDIAFDWRYQESFTGASAAGYTFIWPYYCGNLFPCHSHPADGTTFTLALDNVPAGLTAVFPATISSEAPSYQLAWAIDAYTELPLGTTGAGTALSVWYRPGERDAAQAGTQHLVGAFDWLERAIGPYRFGAKAGPVSVNRAGNASGGMEHHPYWHIAASAIGNEEDHVHEAAHGWFGTGVRLACWEDFVLSEGTTTYLAARALEAVASEAGAAVWRRYTQRLGTLSPAAPVWPQGCGTIDILKDGLYTRAPYLRGAFFYRAVALKVGIEKLDAALAAFYRANALAPARMSGMLQTIATVTGYDPIACADTWLRSSTIPAIGPCP